MPCSALGGPGCDDPLYLEKVRPSVSGWLWLIMDKSRRTDDALQAGACFEEDTSPLSRWSKVPVILPFWRQRQSKQNAFITRGRRPADANTCNLAAVCPRHWKVLFPKSKRMAAFPLLACAGTSHWMQQTDPETL